MGPVAENLVKLGKEDEALGIFKNLDKYKCPIDEFTVTAIVNALCSKGHAKRAGGIIAGATASCITTPLDTIKTRLQVFITLLNTCVILLHKFFVFFS